MVWVGVGGWVMVFEVIVIFGGVFVGNMDGRFMVGDIVVELVDGISFVVVSEMEFVVFVIFFDVFFVVRFEFFDGIFDVFYVIFNMYFFGGEVVVEVSVVLVILDGFGVLGDMCIEIFGNVGKEEVSDLEVVIYFDIFVRVDLEFLLVGYDFGVGVGDFDIRVEVGFVVGFDDVMEDDFVVVDIVVVRILIVGLLEM